MSDAEYEDSLPSNRSKSKSKSKKQTYSSTISIYTNNHPLINIVADELNYDITDIKEDNWSIAWIDGRVIDLAWYKLLKPTQRVNHFPGIEYLARKKSLAKYLNIMYDIYPEMYDFYPRTFLLPEDANKLKEYAGNKKNKTYICKPDASCQGKGIFLTRNLEDIDFGQQIVVQRYLHNPFLINELKFDLRVYVLITSCDPLRLYIMREGLVRFCTEKYEKPSKQNMENSFAHLTNYAINKLNENFVFNNGTDDMSSGGKWSITSLNKWLNDHGYNSVQVWENVHKVVIKTIIAGLPALQHQYRVFFPRTNDAHCCFQLLGFDIMLDSELKPWLIEVNRSPSLATDTPLDLEIKKAAVMDAFGIVNPQPLDSKTMKKFIKMQSQTLSASYTQKEWKEEQVKQQRKFVKKLEKNQTVELGLYDKCFPVSDDPEDPVMKKYDEMAKKATELYESGYQVKRRAPTTQRTAFKIVPSTFQTTKSNIAPRENVVPPQKPRPISVASTVPRNSNINKYSVDTLTTAFSSLIVAANDNMSPKISIPPDQIKKKFEFLDGLISTPTNMLSSSFSYSKKPPINPSLQSVDAETSRSFDSVDKLTDSFKTLVSPEEFISKNDSFFSTKQIPYVHPVKNHVAKPILTPISSNASYNSYDTIVTKSNLNPTSISYDKFLPPSKQPIQPVAPPTKQSPIYNGKITNRGANAEPLILDAYSIIRPKVVETKLTNTSNDSFASLEQYAKKGPKSISEQSSDPPKKFSIITKKSADVNIKGNTVNLNSVHSPKSSSNAKLLFRKILSGTSQIDDNYQTAERAKMPNR